MDQYRPILIFVLNIVNPLQLAVMGLLGILMEICRAFVGATAIPG